MANNIANNLTETFQNIFLAGVGALSIGGEKAKAWIANGAQPTDTVRVLLKKSNIL